MAWTTSSHAHPSPKPKIPDAVVKLRLEGPLWVAGFTNHQAFTTLGSGYVGLELFGWLGIEGGGGPSFSSIAGPDAYATARIGIVPWVVDNRRPDGRGFSLQLDVLASYQHVQLTDEGDGYETTQTNHVLGTALGADFGFHVTPEVGLSVRPLLTVGAVVAGGDEVMGDYAFVPETDWVVTASHSFGLSF
jgi:hypothetical protein